MPFFLLIVNAESVTYSTDLIKSNDKMLTQTGQKTSTKLIQRRHYMTSQKVTLNELGD